MDYLSRMLEVNTRARARARTPARGARTHDSVYGPIWFICVSQGSNLTENVTKDKNALRVLDRLKKTLSKGDGMGSGAPPMSLEALLGASADIGK
jgi:hypothetical protein